MTISLWQGPRENISNNELKEINNEINLTSLLENSNEEINSNNEIKDSSNNSDNEKLIDIKINIVNDIIKNNKTKELQNDENNNIDNGNNIASKKDKIKNNEKNYFSKIEFKRKRNYNT